MKKVIEVKHFKKRFATKQVHEDVSFCVYEHECLGLIGGSGVGKSIILRSLIGLEKPDSGEIWVEGQEISRLSETQLVDIRKRVAYVFQGGALFDSMSVFDNLAYSLREHTFMKEVEIQDKVLSLLKEFRLEGNDKIFPADLSGGMQKRVGLARAIILGPSCILYDEPTAGLDPYNTKKIQDMILRLKSAGTTSILVTHDMPTALAVCDRIIMLGEGKVIADKSLEDLVASHEGPIKAFMDGEIP
ncbi:MAG: ABC transporter ATP-binding protein [Bdellovibrionales bacterium CG10_big_fil_rev_8_21_14_0_10_45_34]|nr:MAG: ABC transporter ATP-binding protein [Bdellovibrionales bacterium CG10_big_fil_rev_8_21_14_0_10_45_34]